MARAELGVTLPEDTWPGRASRAHPTATLSVLSVLPTDEGGVALVSVQSRNAPAVVEAIQRDDDVTEVELQRSLETVNEAVLCVETTDPRLLGALQESRLPVEHPVRIADGEATITVAGARERLSMFVEALEAIGIQVDVRYVHESLDAEEFLTDGQRDLLAAAIDAGYYDTPRGSTLTELADQRGIAKSTASERLHRAEGKVLKRFARESLGVGVDAEDALAPRP